MNEPPFGVIGEEESIPETPIILDSFASPEPRQGATFESTPAFRAYEPRVLTEPSPETILAALRDSPDEGQSDPNARAALVLQHALRWALEYGDVELLGWLASQEGTWGEILDEQVASMEDEDGWGLVGMAIQASCGRPELEEGVRITVGRWGLEAGPRQGQDRTGWTPLHIASIVSTSPLISFLLTRGASPHATTNRGLTPSDLVAGMAEKDQIAMLLEQACGGEAVVQSTTEVSEGRKRMLTRRREQTQRHRARMEEQESRSARQRAKDVWIRERVKVVGVTGDHLLSTRSLEAEDEEGTVPDMELVFSPYYLPTILDNLITSYQPICLPRSRRGLPANAIYLYARFAFTKCDEAWLEELLEGAVQRVEQSVYAHVDELEHLAFWSYNSTLLLHLLTSEEAMRAACDELGLLGMLEELVNAIHVFVIRIAERQIDGILDASILEHEALEELDVRFEDEWTLFRTLGRKPKPTLSRAAQLTEEGGIFNSVRGASLKAQASVQNLRAESRDPQDVTAILTGVLVVLQCYDVNPAITVQVFSQIFFWVACELFNRILTRKKYLCRSKAVQIRMNITALDDWVRIHGIPIRCASRYLEPVMQLLQWLQCLSSVANFGDLIGTVQGLKALNPLQMRKALKEYRYEVHEGRMDEESVTYLGQLQQDWDKRRVETSVKMLQGGSAIEASGTAIDALFDETSLADFEPPSGPECFGELLDSRNMLPFQLPDDPAHLVATPPDNVFAQFLSEDSRPGSRSSFSGSRTLEWSLPGDKVRRLPPDFFSWLREKDTERRHKRRKPLSNLVPAPESPLHTGKLTKPIPIQRDITPTATIRPPISPASSIRTTASIDQMREQATSTFQSVQPAPAHARTESYELKNRNSLNYDSPLRSATFAASPLRSPPASVGSSYIQQQLNRYGQNGPTSPTGTKSSGSASGTWWKKLSRKISQSDLQSDQPIQQGVAEPGSIDMSDFGPSVADDADATVKAGRKGIQSASFWEKP